MMDFNLPEELQMLKDTVRKFVDKELIPIEMHSIDNMELKPDIRERLEKKTKEMGLWMFDVPEEYGSVFRPRSGKCADCLLLTAHCLRLSRRLNGFQSA